MNPVREALDYYRRLNEASKDSRSRRSLEPAPSPAPSTDEQHADSANNNNNNKDEASVVVEEPDQASPSRKTSLASVNEDEAKRLEQPAAALGDQVRDPNAPPPTPVSRDR